MNLKTTKGGRTSQWAFVLFRASSFALTLAYFSVSCFVVSSQVLFKHGVLLFMGYVRKAWGARLELLLFCSLEFRFILIKYSLKTISR